MNNSDSEGFGYKFWILHAGIPFILSLLVLVVFEATKLDIKINNLFYDEASQSFPLREDWFLETVMHHWAKYLLVIFMLVNLAGLVLSFRVTSLKRHRKTMLFIVLAMIMGPSVVSTLKATTNKHCPYDLQIYGGNEPYVRLLEFAEDGGKQGNCFPGGHASGGFALMALYFIWYRKRRRLAYAVLLFGFTYGFVLGWGRMMQGAHFLSHNLWAAIVCWYVSLLLYVLIFRKSHHKQG